MSNLQLLFLFPFVAALILFLLPYLSDKYNKRIGFFLSLAPLIILLVHHQEWIGSSIQKTWFTPLNVEFYLKVDSLSLVFLYLTAILIPISILATDSKGIQNPHSFFGFIILLQGLLIGFFTARDLALFMIFFESMLFPLYFIIAGWGKENRVRAAIEFILYMLAGSVFMIVGLIAIYIAGHTFSLDDLSKVVPSISYASWIAAIFFLAFAVKTPLFPLHAWLPNAYYEAPTAGSILLAGLLSKAGIYGFLRVGTEVFPEQMVQFAPLFIGLSLAGVLYAGLAAYMQNNFKKIIAYSSLSHVNFILAGVFVWNTVAREGAILQSLNHGIIISGLFLVTGFLERRIGTTNLKETGGLAKFLPHLCWLTLFFALASVSLPGTNSFIGELLIFYGFFKSYTWITAILGLSIILSVMYMLRFMRKIYFGPPTFFEASWIDIKRKDYIIALPLILLILWIGIYPSPLLNIIKPAAQNIHQEKEASLSSSPFITTIAMELE